MKLYSGPISLFTAKVRIALAEKELQYERMEDYGDSILFPDLWTLIEEVLYGGQAGTPDPARISHAQQNFAGHFAYLEDRLGGDEYFAGQFGIADITIFIFTNAAAMLGAPVGDSFSQLKAWIERTASRPVVKAETAAMQEFLAKSQSG